MIFSVILRFILYTEQIAEYEYYIGIKYLIKLLLFFVGNDCGSNNHQMMSRNAWNEEEDNEKLIHQHKMECWGFGRTRRLNELTVLWVSLYWNKYTMICFLWFIVDYIKLSWIITLQERQNISMPSFCAEISLRMTSSQPIASKPWRKHMRLEIASVSNYFGVNCALNSLTCAVKWGDIARCHQNIIDTQHTIQYDPISCSGKKHSCYWDMETEIDIDIQLLFVNSIVNKS